jgi:hypothetical protein
MHKLANKITHAALARRKLGVIGCIEIVMLNKIGEMSSTSSGLAAEMDEMAAMSSFEIWNSGAFQSFCYVPRFHSRRLKGVRRA